MEELRRNPKLLAAGLSAQQVGQLYSSGKRRDFSSGKPIIRQGDRGDSMFVLQDGAADVLIGGALVHTFNAGDMFGEASMLSGERRSATVSAVGPVACLEITRETYQQVFNSALKRMQTNPKLLAAGLSPAQIGHLYTKGTRRNYKSGRAIITEGADGASMFLLQDGAADVVAKGGKTVHTFRPGEMFGEASMLTGETRNATVLAVGAVTCLEIDRELYRKVFDEQAQAALASAGAGALYQLQTNPKLLAAGLSPAQIGQLYTKSASRRFEPDAVIILAGDPGRSMFLLQDGAAAVTDTAGEKVYTFSPGEMFGEASMLTGERRNATVLAVGGPVVCLEIDREVYQEVFDERAKAMMDEVQAQTEAAAAAAAAAAAGGGGGAGGAGGSSSKAAVWFDEQWETTKPTVGLGWRPSAVDRALESGRTVQRLEQLSPIRPATTSGGHGGGGGASFALGGSASTVGRSSPATAAASRADVAKALADARNEAAAAAASATDLFQLAKMNQRGRQRRAGAA
eukprot:SAG22_NODE_1694_length_3797_cov_178.253110_1_plen_514_part_10